MSELLISDGTTTSTLPETADEKAKQLPDPVRFHVLTVLPEIDEEYEAVWSKPTQPFTMKKCCRPCYL